MTNWTLRRNSAHEHGHATLKAPQWNMNGLSPVSGVERTIHAVVLPMLLRRVGYGIGQCVEIIVQCHQWQCG